MIRRPCRALPAVALALSLCAMGLVLSPSMAAEQKKFVIKPVVEKKLKQLPAGPLYWQLENFPTLAQAKAVAGETSLAAEISGEVWLLTLGPKDSPTHGGRKVAEIGPIPRITAPEYLLRDRDSIYGKAFKKRVKSLGIEEVVTAPRSPWRWVWRRRARRRA